MVKTPLAFEFSKTRTICDAFDQAWAFLQGLGSDLHGRIQLARDANDPGQAHIIEMADQGLTDVPELP
jgi:hypothetical protein